MGAGQPRIQPPRIFAGLVIGYSGRNDQLLSVLKSCGNFYGGLYWFLWDQERDLRVPKSLVEEKKARLIPIEDADSALVELARLLGCFPPKLVLNPASHLDELLAPVTPWPMPGSEGPANLFRLVADATGVG